MSRLTLGTGEILQNHASAADSPAFTDEFNSWVSDAVFAAFEKCPGGNSSREPHQIKPMLLFVPEDGIGSFAEIDRRRPVAVQRRIAAS